jgi:hypothetical protein
VIAALTAALNAFVEYIRWKRDRRLDDLEDELDRLAADGSPSSKLRIERIARRIEREQKRTL